MKMCDIKTTFKKIGLAAMFLLVSFPAFAQEITAIDFNGDLIGKVIPDGKVVSFDNKLIGNINADSLIIDSTGELIGGIVPQGIAIGNDNKVLGKVNNDGTVRLASGKVIGKTLPNGLVVDDFFEVTGFVLFPGLVYSDDGITVGRLTGDGSYTNLQGQKIGFVSPDGYAYRQVENDYILDGKLISSKMVVSLTGEFLGSVSPGGEVTDSNTNIIGRIKANNYVYDSGNKIIGKVVSAGYAFDNYGTYIGHVNYNGEVINKEQLVGRLTSTDKVVDLSGKVIGYSLGFATTFTDANGKYIGRLVPNGKIVKAKDEIGEVTSRGLALKDGTIIGIEAKPGPVFDFRGVLIAHAGRNGSVVLFEGTNIGNMKGDFAYNKTGEIIGAVSPSKLIIDLNNTALGVNDVNSSIGAAADKLMVSPFGYVFSADGRVAGQSVNMGTLYDFDNNTIAEISPNGEALNKNNIIPGKITPIGAQLVEGTKILSKTFNSNYIVGNDGKNIGYLSNLNVVFGPEKRVVGKVLTDGTIVSTTSEDSTALMPKMGQSYTNNVVLDITGKFIGYANVNGQVRNRSDALIGQVIERDLVLDAKGSFIGQVLPYTTIVDEECKLLGVLTPKGDIRNYKNTYVGRQLLNGQVISDVGLDLGYAVKKGIVVDDNNNVLGVSTPLGTIVNYENQSHGCISPIGTFKDSDGTINSKITSPETVMDFQGNIIGRSNLLGMLVDNNGKITGYVQSNDNVNSRTGTPLGHMFRYKFAFNNDNKLIGVVMSNGDVLGSGNNILGKVDFNGQVLSGNNVVGYALYDLYVYNDNNISVGYISSDGSVMSFTGQNVGKIDKGFTVDKTGKAISRGNRDFYIRDGSNNVLGELKPDGTMVDAKGEAVGSLDTLTGIITDTKTAPVAEAHPLQYYSKTTSTKIVYDEHGNIIGYVSGDGSVIDDYGKIIALLNDDGFAVSANGAIIGGVGSDWYEKAPKDQVGNIEIGVLDRQTAQEKAMRSLGIALTPDGDFLGNILENGRVVDANGNILGRKMPDGLIIDDDGNLIGVEENKKIGSETSGVFVPAGTFGAGGAYGVGEGSGNLGPGGGYGTGERYDPQRAAALSVAHSQRRQNISVGKISTSINKSSFDGMQKDWSEQGIGKNVSSWRVNMSEMILADKPIPAVIARSIDSNNPTPVTAIVERNIYAEEGRNIIIPAGSRVMGTLLSLTASTETTSSSAKVQITWERLIRPDGSIFVFAGITGDAQGRGGALGYLDQQLFKKYALPVATTMLTSAATYIMAPNGESSTDAETPKQEAASDARQNFLSSMNSIFNQMLNDKTNIKPLTYVPAGTRIIIYPNVDLWLRTPEREHDDSVSGDRGKRNILIDDKQTTAKRESNEASRQVVSEGTGSSSVVYEADNPNAQPQRPRLIDDRATTASRKQATTVGAAPPPPPPTTTTAPSSGTSSKVPTGSGVQLF